MNSVARNLSSACLCAALAGCLSIPSPQELARSCAQPYDTLHFRSVGSPQRYRESVHASCEDAGTSRTSVAVERRGSADAQSVAINYQDQLGQNVTRGRVTASKSGRALVYESASEGTRGGFVWYYRSKIVVHP